MSTVKKIGKNISFLVIGNVIQKIISLVMVIFLAQKLGVADFGLYSFVFSFVVMFLVFGDLGIGTLILREIARDESKASELIGNAFVIRIGLFFLVLLAIFASIFLLHFLRSTEYPFIVVIFVLIAGLSLLFDSMTALFRVVFLAFQETQYDFYVNTSVKILLAFLTLSVLFLGYGIKEVLFVDLFSNFVGFALGFFVVTKKFARPKFSLNFSEHKKMLVKALPFCYIAVFMSFYSSIIPVLLSVFKGNLSLGYYAAATRLINIFSFIPVVFMSAVFPVMAAFHASSNKSVNTIILKSFKYLLIVILPIAFATTLLSGRIIELVYPTTQFNNFAPASAILSILIWFLVLNFLNFVFLTVFQSTAFEKKALIVVVVSLAANIFFSLLLIPRYDFIGAAFASVLSEAIFLISGFYFISKHFFNVFYFFRILVKPLAASIAVFAFIYLFFFLNIFVLIVVSSLLYFFVLFFIKGFDKEDISFFIKFISKDHKN
jgi:O-antigen/teichoic acid export membrane protein